MKLVIELSETYPTNIQRVIANGKPLIACQECGKTLWNPYGTALYCMKRGDRPIDWVVVDSDDYCKDGEAK